ncbi:MAG: amidohydrolase, partial [Rhodospirillales bacterium]|nr:amidohydrolase [Rhodospirillales bacterium]
DVLVPIAFDTKLNHFGAKLKVTFSSDIGHWDVPDMLKVLPEAYEFVEDGKLDVDQFREFTFENQVQLLGGMNPYYFVGTAVEAEAAKLLAG